MLVCVPLACPRNNWTSCRPRIEASPLFWNTLQRAAGYRDRAHKEPSHIGYFWIRVQKRLADAYRAAGRKSDAELIESDLLRVLATADADFPLLVELQSRSGPNQYH